MARKRPPLVSQNDVSLCWAACMESWTRTSWQYTPRNQDSLAGDFGTPPTYGLKYRSAKYNLFLILFGLDHYVFPGGTFNAKWAKYFIERGDCFILIFQTGRQQSHAMLAYELRGNQLRAMDPRRGYQVGPANGFGDAILCLYFNPIT